MLQRLIDTNAEPSGCYGFDVYCDEAKKKIMAACKNENADIFFMSGGTQTNATVIDAVLQKYEGVVAAETGHISCHEAGAIEYTGHKVLELPSHDGKMDAEELEEYLQKFWQDETHEHMVFPGMVYLSHPTEYGTLYSREELKAISVVCQQFHIPLYLDGARLGYGLMSQETDVTLQVVAKYCDVFYIGGTKVGALCGEAVVFTKKNMPKYFMTMVKQHGALLAKGRLLGIQFDALFTDELYFKISKHAILMAQLLKEGFQERGYEFYLESPTNQQFIVLENEEMERLKEKVSFGFWEKVDDKHTVVRFATSWATQKEDVDRLMEVLEENKK